VRQGMHLITLPHAVGIPWAPIRLAWCHNREHPPWWGRVLVGVVG
jgi:hypothetical protein